ncbi:MAG: hypothetical protein R3F59_10870 [Myxococcota bacterium]
MLWIWPYSVASAATFERSELVAVHGWTDTGAFAYEIVERENLWPVPESLEGGETGERHYVVVQQGDAIVEKWLVRRALPTFVREDAPLQAEAWTAWRNAHPLSPAIAARTSSGGVRLEVALPDRPFAWANERQRPVGELHRRDAEGAGRGPAVAAPTVRGGGDVVAARGGVLDAERDGLCVVSGPPVREGGPVGVAGPELGEDPRLHGATVLDELLEQQGPLGEAPVVGIDTVDLAGDVGIAALLEAVAPQRPAGLVLDEARGEGAVVAVQTGGRQAIRQHVEGFDGGAVAEAAAGGQGEDQDLGEHVRDGIGAR